jgi:hypothetical protein
LKVLLKERSLASTVERKILRPVLTPPMLQVLPLGTDLAPSAHPPNAAGSPPGMAGPQTLKRPRTNSPAASMAASMSMAIDLTDDVIPDPGPALAVDVTLTSHLPSTHPHSLHSHSMASVPATAGGDWGTLGDLQPGRRGRSLHFVQATST